MPRTLHIVEPARTSWAMMARLIGERRAGDAVIVLGGSGGARVAELVGIRPSVRVAPALGCDPLGWATVRRLVHRAGLDEFEGVHAWSIGALGAARLAFPSVLACATLSSPPNRTTGCAARLSRRWIDACAGVRFSTVALRDAWAFALGPSAINAGVLHVDAGAARFAAATPASRAREQWRVSDDERVLLALADAPSFVDARRFIFHCGVVSIAGKRLVGVVPPQAMQMERAVRFTRRHHGAWRLVIDDTPMPHLLGCADAAMPSSAHSEWSVAMARAAGVPVVDAALANENHMGANSALLHALEAAGPRAS